MKMFKTLSIAAGAAALMLSGLAQAQSRGPGWEFGADILYQLGQDIEFNGGSTAELEDDWGLTFNFGYRFDSRLEVQFALDWSDVDYDATLQRTTNTTPPLPLAPVGVSGSYEAFTPRVSVHYNFSDGPIAPYVKGGIGYSFIDTNIPDGRPSNVCWWDPWWGYVCGTVQDTRSVDGFTYDIGLGVRWDFSPGYSLRAAYEKHWIDLSEANGTPDLDQIKLGIVYRY